MEDWRWARYSRSADILGGWDAHDCDEEESEEAGEVEMQDDYDVSAFLPPWMNGRESGVVSYEEDLLRMMQFVAADERGAFALCVARD